MRQCYTLSSPDCLLCALCRPSAALALEPAPGVPLASALVRGGAVKVFATAHTARKFKSPQQRHSRNATKMVTFTFYFWRRRSILLLPLARYLFLSLAPGGISDVGAQIYFWRWRSFYCWRWRPEVLWAMASNFIFGAGAPAVKSIQKIDFGGRRASELYYCQWRPILFLTLALGARFLLKTLAQPETDLT